MRDPGGKVAAPQPVTQPRPSGRKSQTSLLSFARTPSWLDQLSPAQEYLQLVMVYAERQTDTSRDELAALDERVHGRSGHLESRLLSALVRGP